MAIQATPINVGQARNHKRIARAYYVDFLRFGSKKAKLKAAYHYAKAAVLLDQPNRWTL